MAKIVMKAKSFKKMEDPINREEGHFKYVCYVKADSIPEEILEWMETNPRQQNMKTAVAMKIIDSLKENENFHELNRGIVLSAESVVFDNKKELIEVEFNDINVHGDIDGGHTLRATIELKEEKLLEENRYVFFEIFTGIHSPVELAAARNTSNQVDNKSIQELEKNFEIIKEVIKDMPFSDRVSYKMYEQDEQKVKKDIDVREIIAILLMFFQNVYPCVDKNGDLNEVQPVQCYTGKEATLKKFIKLGKAEREKTIEQMKNIIPEIFYIWDTIETNFNKYSRKAGKLYVNRSYAKKKQVKTATLFSRKERDYIVPRGLIYPIVGAFRALIRIDSETGNYYWSKDPKQVLEKLGGRLVGIVLDEKADSPEYIGKSTNLWNNLFKELYIEGHLAKN